jgi:hypothetical protein
MSVNKYTPHILVLPEDDANRQLANGFLLHPSLSTQIQVLEEVGGWSKVLDCFEKDHVKKMGSCPKSVISVRGAAATARSSDRWPR